MALLKRPSALVPLAMSLAALSLVLGHVALYGAAREPDEGAAAHLWQLLMAGRFRSSRSSRSHGCRGHQGKPG